jgi:hypothetical protein
MPYPCYFLEGSQYKNLTSIRVSDDRFMRARWNDFLYTSRLARSLGIWPWTDVFMSSETDNFLLSVLSAGPVGIGDPIGKEDMANISRAVRADGVIIKPDVPCVPLDQCYLRDANKGPKPSDPLLAWTCTDHHPLRTAYLFCYSRNSAIPTSASFSPSELGFKGTVYIYEPATGSGARQDAASSFSIALQPNQSHFYVIAPVGSSGIAFLGDSAKFVGTGKQRVSEITDSPEGIATTLLMCESEDSLQLHGYAPSAPTVTVKGGKAGPVNFDAATGHYTVGIFSEPASGANQPGSVRAVEVNITAHSRESGQNNQLDAGEAGS